MSHSYSDGLMDHEMDLQYKSQGSNNTHSCINGRTTVDPTVFASNNNVYKNGSSLYLIRNTSATSRANSSPNTAGC